MKSKIKIGRNQPCPCGSKIKFKRCHGAGNNTASFSSNMNSASSKIVSSMKTLEFQRQRQQGYGRPIISTAFNGQRAIAIGNKLAIGNWQTFTDFLMHHLRVVFGETWWINELSNPEEKRHYVLIWARILSELQRKNTTNHNGINSMPEFGVVRAFIGLAYDLYTLEHNAQNTRNREVFDRLVRRLRHPQQFLGARYEARVAGFFLRAGFELAWDDEMDGTTTHGEFIACFPETGRQFWVECKMRQSDVPTSKLGKFTGLVSDALRKEANLERFIFIELNTPAKNHVPKLWSWREWAIGKLRILEENPSAAVLPSAFVMVTNFPEHHHLDEFVPDTGGALEGFKLTEYRYCQELPLEAVISMRDRNPEIDALLRSIGEHHEIPSTFDGSIPGLHDIEDRLIIGNRYELEDGKIGILLEACVLEQERKAATVMQMENGTNCIYTFELSDSELAAAKRYPETFFGKVTDYNSPSEDALGLYDFFYKCYKKTSKERLIELMVNHNNIDELINLPQDQLAKTYSLKLTQSALSNKKGFSQPDWINRLRPVPI